MRERQKERGGIERQKVRERERGNRQRVCVLLCGRERGNSERERVKETKRERMNRETE